MTIIGLLGPASSGKSSVAQWLVDNYGAKRYSLATLLKEIARKTLDFTDEQVYGTQAQKETVDPRYGFSPRWFLQRLGTEGVRATLGADFWTQALLRQISLDGPELAVVDDLRFKNEAKIFSEDPRDGYVWRLWPPSDAEMYRRQIEAGSHSSEREWRDAVADREISPAQRGLDELFRLAEQSAIACGLRRTA